MTLPLLNLIERAETSTPVSRRWRLVRATTKAAWYAMRDSLAEHERVVYWGLMAYWNRYQCWPTGMELFEFLDDLRKRKPQHPRYRLIKDINNVRPRLTCLNQRDPAVVVTGEKRPCRSRHANGNPKVVLTWRIPQVGEAVRDGRTQHNKGEAA